MDPSLSASSEALYRDFWTAGIAERQQYAYYDRLYSRLRHKITIDPAGSVLDIAGGNGQSMCYLGVRNGTVIDISESGLQAAAKLGFKTMQADIERRFPVEEGTFDYALLFEVLEHLRYPNLVLTEARRALKPGGILYVAQPNMPPDGVYHVRRYYRKELLDDLTKAGFKIGWIDYIPAYSSPDAIVDDIRRNPSWIRKGIQCVNLTLSLLPRSIRYRMAQLLPDRFAMLFVVAAVRA